MDEKSNAKRDNNGGSKRHTKPSAERSAKHVAAGRRNYKKGRLIEYEARNILRDKTYVVIRSAGSKGPADIIAGKSFETWAIEIKNHPPTKEEFEKVKMASLDWWVYHAIAWKHDGKWSSKIYFRGEEFDKRKSPIE